MGEDPKTGFRFNKEIGFGSVMNFILLVGAIMGFMMHYEHRMTIVEQAAAVQVARDAGQDVALSVAVANINNNIIALGTKVDSLTKASR